MPTSFHSTSSHTTFIETYMFRFPSSNFPPQNITHTLHSIPSLLYHTISHSSFFLHTQNDISTILFIYSTLSLTPQNFPASQPIYSSSPVLIQNTIYLHAPTHTHKHRFFYFFEKPKNIKRPPVFEFPSSCVYLVSIGVAFTF